MPQTSLPFPAIYGAFVGWGNIPWLLNIDGSLDCTMKLRKGIGKFVDKEDIRRQKTSTLFEKPSKTTVFVKITDKKE